MEFPADSEERAGTPAREVPEVAASGARIVGAANLWIGKLPSNASVLINKKPKYLCARPRNKN